MKYTVLIFLALCIDGLQMLLSWGFLAIGGALEAITPYGGGAAGAFTGAGVCYSSADGVITGIIEGAKCAGVGGFSGAVASAIGIPLGTAMGFVSDFCISATLGVGLILLLIFNGMYYSKPIGMNGLLELVPGFNMLPGWTTMVVLCILRKKAEEGALDGSAAGSFAQTLAKKTFVGQAFSAVKTIQQKRTATAVETGAVTDQKVKGDRVGARQELKTHLRGIDGITPKQPQPTTSRPAPPRSRYAI